MQPLGTIVVLARLVAAGLYARLRWDDVTVADVLRPLQDMYEDVRAVRTGERSAAVVGVRWQAA